MLEAVLAIAFIGCVLMALRAWRLKHGTINDLPDLMELVGTRVAVTVAMGGRVRFGTAAPALLEEVNGDWVRLTWLGNPVTAGTRWRRFGKRREPATLARHVRPKLSRGG